jgi:signal transduction histidine kinase
MSETPFRPRPSGRLPAPVKCLIVDDLEENRLALSALLRRDDVEVLTAGSGAEALELLLVHEIALAFLDVQMPEMDGFELAELIRGSERTRHIPLIFITAGGRDQQRIFRGYEAGAVDFLFKPIEPHVLASKADVFFQLHRQKQLLAHELQERSDALRMNEMFTAVLGHDLRTPLSVIATSAYIVNARSDDPAVRAATQRMVASSRTMGRMIGDLLDLTRARLGGGIPVSPQACDLAQVIARSLEECSATHPGRVGELSVRGDTQGEWDPDRLAQAATNLIGNALKHGEPTGPIEVAIDGRLPREVVLEVRNPGTIPPELLPHIFDPFRTRSRGRGNADGLGLGLYIVREILAAHGGSVEVDSGADGHTTFRVRVPRHPSGGDRHGSASVASGS